LTGVSVREFMSLRVCALGEIYAYVSWLDLLICLLMKTRCWLIIKNLSLVHWDIMSTFAIC